MNISLLYRNCMWFYTLTCRNWGLTWYHLCAGTVLYRYCNLHTQGALTTVGVHNNALKRVRAFKIELEFGNVVFFRGEENRSAQRKTSRSKGENQQQTQPTYGVDARIRTWATLVGGECSHLYAILQCSS